MREQGGGPARAGEGAVAREGAVQQQGKSSQAEIGRKMISHATGLYSNIFLYQGAFIMIQEEVVSATINIWPTKVLKVMLDNGVNFAANAAQKGANAYH